MAGETFRVGGVTYPLPTGTARPLLYDADPALYFALAFTRTLLERTIGQRLVEACSAVTDPANPKAGLAVTGAVAHVTHLDPGRVFYDKPTIRFPLLAIYRTGTTFADHTVVHERVERQWGIAYVLPAMTWQQQEKIVPILHAVEHVLMVGLHRGSDPGYDNGTHIWDDAHGGVQSVRLVSGAIGAFETAVGFPYPAWTGRLEVRERTGDALGALAPFTGADLTASIANDDPPDADNGDDGDDDEPLDVLELATDVTPPDPG